jgi:GntR family transcriptional regulator/MocR family aminotransferase
LRRSSLYLRFADDLRRRIRAGDLPTGTRLPSSRALAKQLGVSRNTVVAAYELLAWEGLLATRHGSGTRVLAARPVPLRPQQLLRDAHYPSWTLRFRDPDGNPVLLQQ